MKIIDNDLIERALANDNEAISFIINTYKRSLMLFISKYVSNEDDAEDVSQETFDKVFRNLGAYNDSYAFSTWLYTIAKNCCIDYCRKNRISYSSLNEIAMCDLAIESPEESLINKQTYKDIKDAINSLDDKYREVAELRFMNEYAYDEIATMLDLPINTVKTRIKRAKEQLNKIWSR